MKKIKIFALITFLAINCFCAQSFARPKHSDTRMPIIPFLVDNNQQEQKLASNIFAVISDLSDKQSMRLRDGDTYQDNSGETTYSLGINNSSLINDFNLYAIASISRAILSIGIQYKLITWSSGGVHLGATVGIVEFLKSHGAGLLMNQSLYEANKLKIDLLFSAQYRLSRRTYFHSSCAGADCNTSEGYESKFNKLIIDEKMHDLLLGPRIQYNLFAISIIAGYSVIKSTKLIEEKYSPSNYSHSNNTKSISLIFDYSL